MRTVLLVAFHFPPIAGSSGLQRTLRFAQYLPEFGWTPIVLTVTPDTYEEIDEGLLAQVPSHCTVVRTACIDAGRHLSFLGRYPHFVAIPDRWSSWRWWAVRAGARLVRERRVDAVWSTYPIATAHEIGAAISRRTGVPWIADFRDPMAQPGYPPDRRRWEAFRRIEGTAAERAARMVFVSPSAMQLYRRRYAQTPGDRFVLIENGYDESSFEGIAEAAPRRKSRTPVLLHSGIVYPKERDPTALFVALGRLAASEAIRPGDFVLRFRAAVHESLLRNLARKHGVEEYVDLQPPIPYLDALREMLDADALLLMQGANCNEQIPAKLYEYLRAARPVFGLADPNGDTGRKLSELGYSHVIALESAEEIESALPDFLARLHAETLPTAGSAAASLYSRRTLTRRLAALLDSVVADSR